ncbi:MAG TPA: TetR/AcrR family transcriptional regulator [Nitrospinota bacterium]|nr:TetR/AcrR family transcriptional regulator [Nitrospinota bacterium]
MIRKRFYEEGAMPRAKEFSETEALAQAMEVFWGKGYEATSLQDLISAMEISKSSFYVTFGSKYELFMAAIGSYNETRVEAAVKMLDGEASGKKAIENIFAYFVEYGEQYGERGCFLCNCAVEFAQRNRAVAEQIALGMDRIEDAYHRAVIRGQKAGEIPPSRDARSLARYLLSCENGLLVSAMAGMDQRKMKEVAQVTLMALE